MRIAAHPLSRRQFLANSARAATGLAAANLVLCPASAPGEPRRLSPNDRINIAFIGTGGRATTNIAEVTKAEDVNVVALCDVDETNLKSAGERFPNAKPYRDFRKLLQMEKVLDAVVISVPDHIPAPATIKLGKHVYCEKPPTRTVTEARAAARAASEAKVATQMGNQGMAFDGNRSIKEWLADGVIGSVHEVHVWSDRPTNGGKAQLYWQQGIERPVETPPVPATLDWDLWLGPAPVRPYHPATPPVFSFRRFTSRFGLLLLLSASATHGEPAPPISLAGQWRFQLDRADVGFRERWFERGLPDKIALPGSLPLQGVGDLVTTNTTWLGTIVDQSWFTAPEYARYRQPGNVKVPFWLTPQKYYAGAAWYQREIEIPQDWRGKRVVLSLERPHWETRLWLDSLFIGTNNSLGTPHDYDLGQPAPGRHTVSVRVDNRMVVPIGENSHSISDHTQGDWNGIIGRIELRVTPLVWIEDLQVYPRLATRSALVRGRLGNATGSNLLTSVGLCLLDRFDARPRLPATNVLVHCTPDGASFEAEVKCGNEVVPWDEFNPHLYELTAQTGAFPDALSQNVIFGFREISTTGTQFSLNDKKLFFRGTLDCAAYPRTGHPPTDVESWKRVIQTAKAHGLNEIRFHSWCPPEAAFVAADELGFYFHVEACSWANDRSTSLGDGLPVDAWIYAETARILKYYGNHPSFLLMVYGNEPGGKRHADYLAKFVGHYRSLDPRRLWSSGAGWPELPQNQWHNIPEPRIQAWGAGLKSRINAHPPETVTDYRANIARRSVPVVSHEIGQWCVYPNFDELRKYTGYLKPGNFEIFHQFLAEHGLGNLGHEFLLASGKLQALCYKEEIESALRTPGMGGFELLDLHDFPGQGTALVGVLDAFWEEKGYVTPKEFSRFCNAVVPLARLKKRVFTTDERLEAVIDVSNFSAAPLENERASWKLVSERGKAVTQGSLPEKSVAVGGLTQLGQVSLELNNLPAPARYKLVVSVAGGKFENDWDVWLYPARTEVEPGRNILVAAQFDEAAQAHLHHGGNLLLTIPATQVRNFDTAPVKPGFSTIFWNTAWTKRQPPTTMGILCDPKHLALADFPTDSSSNWQWWYLIHRAGALRLDLLPPDLKPIVRIIDDWFTARPLGLVLEAKAGTGKIMVCGFDLTSDSDDPVSKQLRASLLRYMSSDHFKPATELSFAQISSLLAAP